jgi:hypothetical protein
MLGASMMELRSSRSLDSTAYSYEIMIITTFSIDPHPHLFFPCLSLAYGYLIEIATLCITVIFSPHRLTLRVTPCFQRFREAYYR